MSPGGKQPRRQQPNRQQRRRQQHRGQAAGKPASPAISLRLVRGQEAWEFVHPPEAAERREDLDEVRAMIDNGEYDVARDELRWLLDGCHDLLEAHRLLGEIALETGELDLARAHFGYAYEIGLKALPQGRPPGPLPYSIAANQAFLESAKGLAWAFRELGRADRAREVLTMLLACDSSDPLGAAAILSALPPT